jgi:hypothetical protein
MRVVTLMLALAAAFAGYALQPPASAGPAPSRVVDRTMLCATTPLGGIREVEVRAHAGIRQGGSSWKQLPFAVVSSGAVGSRVTALDNSLAWITAARPGGTTTMDTGFNLSWPHTSGTLALSSRCRASTAPVSLSPSRPQGGSVGVFGDSYDCPAPRRVLVRVRAVLQAASGLHSTSGFLRTITPADEATLALRAESGKPLVYAQVVASGRARLFTAGNCVPE